MKKEDLKDFFPYGVSYYRPITPLPCHWDTDLKNIKECGFNSIRVSAFWSRIEKEEGIYDFSEFDSICNAAAKYNIKVLMTLYIVNMPEWMFTKYPDARMVSAANRIQYSEHHPDAVAGGWPGLCMDCDEVMDAMKHFVKEITLHYKGNDTLLAFDVIHEPWEEPSQEYYIDSWKNSVYCYCEHSIEKFKNWLKNKYKNLQNLNMAWSRCYSDWNQVQPPRNFGAYTDWLDWRNFSISMLTKECQEAGQTVKKYDPERIIVNHCGGVLNAFNTSSDTFALAKTVDIPGASNYSFKSPQDAGMSCDFLRSASQDDGNFWIGETSGGSGPMFVFNGEDIERFFAFGMPWTKKIQRKHIWKMISHGAKGVFYWMWRPELYGCETAAMGFTDREGGLTERTENATEISAIIHRYKKFFLNSKVKKADIAVLYNRNTSILEGYASTAKSIQGNAGLFAKYKDISSLSGLAKMCMDNSINVDYVNDDLIISNTLDDYKILILPYSICISKSVVEKIKAFVKSGGIIVADALCGYFKEDGWGNEIVPGNGLNDIFGCKVLEYGYSLDTTIVGSDELSSLKYRSKYVAEHLDISGGKIIGYFDGNKPAIIENKYGKGCGIYFGSSIFMHAKENTLKDNKKIMDYILQKANVTNEISISKENSSIEVRTLETVDKQLLIIMNHGSDCIDASISIKNISYIKSFSDIENSIPINYNLKDSILTFNISMKDLEVRLFMLEK